jgi:hypothetical protein
MTGGSLCAVLDHVRAALPASLVDAEGYARIAAVAAALPADVTTFWGLECRLGATEAAADILFETRNRSRGQQLLAGRLPSQLDALRQPGSVWESVQRFADAWAAPESPLARTIRNLWLEFDTAGAWSPARAGEALRRPSVFCGPVPDIARDSRPILDALSLFGHAAGDVWNLDAFMSVLPDGARVFQAGLMLSRPTTDLRVCVNKLPPDALAAWLPRTGWRGNAAALRDLFSVLAPLTQTMAVGVDLTADGPADDIGLECYQDWLVDDAQQWVPLLDMLEAWQLCRPSKRQGLLDFPGITQLPDQDRRRDDGVIYLNLFRKIHHLKLRIAAGRVTEAKAYLALSRPAVPFGPSSTALGRDAWLIE